MAELSSPAKINLVLAVDGVDEKGYHFIETLMAPVSLKDRISVILDKEGKGFFISSNIELPEENTLKKAYQLFTSILGREFYLEVRIEKIIPPGGGLGGGSSNGAVLLDFLNQAFGSPLKREELLHLSSKIGMDAPFFILGKPCWMTGRGEVFRSFAELPEAKLLLVYPGFPSSTKKVYERFKGKKDMPKRFPQKISLDELVRMLRNDLEEPFLELFPEGMKVKKTLEALEPIGLSLTGSGSCYFAIFEDYPPLESLKERGWKVFKTHIMGGLK